LAKLEPEDKPILAHFHAFIDPANIKVEGHDEEQSHELRFQIEDELRISTGFYDPSEVLIEFDGGAISLSRKLFLQLLNEYNAKYEKDIHHSAIDELREAIKVLPEKTMKRFDHDLQFLRQQLDQVRTKKET